MSEYTLRVAFLIGRADMANRQAIARICEMEKIQVVGVLCDTTTDRTRSRWRNLKRNFRREGFSYLFYRGISALRAKLEVLAERVIPSGEVDELLDKAFPDRNLNRLAERHGFRMIETQNLNGDTAIRALREANADLGVVLGTRILKRAVFSIPRLGCINLHKGKVPEYRGTPPGFWELFDGKSSAGVTVHFVDDGLDSGDIVGESELPIHPRETPESLKTKLDQAGIELLVTVLHQIQRGKVVRQRQPPTNLKPRKRPTRAQTMELARRLPHWRRLGDGRQVIKNAIWLVLFHSGFYSAIRWMRRGKTRGAILLYHRVNDCSNDVLTATTRRFAEHLVTLRHYYRLIATEELIASVASHLSIEPTSVAIHFDDCYLDVRAYAAPLLAAAQIPAVAFISSGFVDTSRVFLHDEEKFPQRFQNLRTQDLRELPTLGVEIAAHTVNHADLGSVALAQANIEVVESRRQLEQITGRPVLLFSFPFGKITNIRQEVREMVAQAGYKALFSAEGGFVGSGTSLFDIPRFGVSSDHSPLALMMELEGLSGSLRSLLRRWFRRV